MGRLDDHAKRRIVELRRAGLSFRKIKKVLELDDIRVTPQAVYLFLKRKSVEPGSAAAGWDRDQLWPPLQGHEAEPPRLLDTRHPALPTGDPMGSRAPCCAGSQDTKEGIQIVSVASLCKDSGHLGDTLAMELAPANGKAWPHWDLPWPLPGTAGLMKGPHSPLETRQGPLFEVFLSLLLQVMIAPQAQPWLQGLLWGVLPPCPSHCPAEHSW